MGDSVGLLFYLLLATGCYCVVGAMTDSWRDKYRDEKDESGLTWDEFHERRFVHVDELESATTTLEALATKVDALTNEYKELRRELQEVRILYESDDFEP